MRLSTRGRYAVMALTEMARRGLDGPGGAPVTLAEIARAGMLSVAYLEQLFGRLRRAGLVHSARGPGGGYRLARPADSIAVAEVVEAVDDLLAGPEGAPSDMPDDQRELWQELGEQVRFFLSAVTLQDVAEGRALGRAVPVPDILPPRPSADTLYLDANATEPLRPEAREAARAAMDLLGNPSSVHAEGRAARRVLEEARARVAARFGGAPPDVVFTSGGTEANAMAIASLARGRRVLYGATEHVAVTSAARLADPAAAPLPVRPDGRIDLGALESALAAGGPALVCLMAAQNETGVLHPLEEAAALCRRHGALLHLDAVQAAGRVPVSLAATGADSLAVSGHKLGGPKGAGALLLRPGLDLLPMMAGGGQERGRRGGTEALPAIAGLGAAAEAADPAHAARLAPLRDAIEAALGQPVAGAAAPRLPNTACVVLPGIPAETQVIALDLEGVRISAGAACSSGRVARSAVLDAMGLGAAAGEAVRVSIPWNAPPDTADRFVAAYRAMRGRLVRPA